MSKEQVLVVRAPFNGMVGPVNVGVRDVVDTNTVLLNLIAMKMEHKVIATKPGRINFIVKTGAKVNKNDRIAVIDISAVAPLSGKGSDIKTAAKRVHTLSSQLNQDNSWTQMELNKIQKRKEIAKNHGGPERVKRQRDAGKLTARERILAILDSSSFFEIGSIAGSATYDSSNTSLQKFIPANYVGGLGTIRRRKVVIGADDFTVRGGHSDGGVWRKPVYIESIALEFRIPMIRLLDGSSGGGSVATILTHGSMHVPELPGFYNMIPLMTTVPVVTGIVGPVVGLGAAKAMLSHFCVMVKEIGQLFVAGPPVVKYATMEDTTKEELGGVKVCGESGAVDCIVDSEAAAFKVMQQFLSYFPSSAWHLPPIISAGTKHACADKELLTIIPKDRRSTYDIRRVITLIVDQRDDETADFFEIGANWGRTAVCGLARIGGFVVGIVSGDCTVLGGVVTTASSQKMERFMDVCDCFHIPIVGLMDCPGFAVGTQAEREGTIRAGARLLATRNELRVPWLSVVIRRVFGVAGAGLVGTGYRLFWPSADSGSLPFEGGVEAAFRRKLGSTGGEAAVEKIRVKLEKIRGSVRAAGVFEIEEVVDPRETRKCVISWVQLAYHKMQSGPITPRPAPFRP